MCTPWASDRVVLVPDWAGLRMFGPESSVCKGWNLVESHLGHSIPLVRGGFASNASNVWTLTRSGSL